MRMSVKKQSQKLILKIFIFQIVDVNKRRRTKLKELEKKYGKIDIFINKQESLNSKMAQ